MTFSTHTVANNHLLLKFNELQCRLWSPQAMHTNDTQPYLQQNTHMYVCIYVYMSVYEIYKKKKKSFKLTPWVRAIIYHCQGKRLWLSEWRTSTQDHWMDKQSGWFSYPTPYEGDNFYKDSIRNLRQTAQGCIEYWGLYIKTMFLPLRIQKAGYTERQIVLPRLIDRRDPDT